MKDNLEDLLQQVYAKKEEPSQEFCQSVIQRLKEGNRKRFLGTGERIYYQRILIAAICAGIIILAGVGMHFCLQGGSQDREAFRKQRIAEHGDPVSDTTKEPSGVENEVETENPSVGKKQVETSPIPDNMQEHQKENSGANAGYPNKADDASGTVSGSNHNLSTKPGGTRAEGSDAELDSDTGSKNRKPQIMETAEPKGTSKPTGAPASIEAPKPLRTSEPEETPRPPENYIAVCSMETYEYPSDLHSSTEEGVDVPESIFDSRFILTYEQLQLLRAEIEERLVQKPDPGLQGILLQLKGYDQSYFASNVLCINLELMDVGAKLKLQAVRIKDRGQGYYYLDICLDKTYDETEQTVGKKYYGSFVSVPQTIAGKCSMVQFHYSG